MTKPEQYDQGVAVGRILERMSEYDKHFAEINGSVGKTGDRLGRVEGLLDRILMVMVNASESAGASEARHESADQGRGKQAEWAKIATLLGIVNSLLLLALLFVR